MSTSKNYCVTCVNFLYGNLCSTSACSYYKTFADIGASVPSCSVDACQSESSGIYQNDGTNNYCTTCPTTSFLYGNVCSLTACTYYSTLGDTTTVGTPSCSTDSCQSESLGIYMNDGTHNYCHSGCSGYYYGKLCSLTACSYYKTLAEISAGTPACSIDACASESTGVY